MQFGGKVAAALPEEQGHLRKGRPAYLFPGLPHSSRVCLCHDTSPRQGSHVPLGRHAQSVQRGIQHASGRNVSSLQAYRPPFSGQRCSDSLLDILGSPNLIGNRLPPLRLPKSIALDFMMGARYAPIIQLVCSATPQSYLPGCGESPISTAPRAL